MKVKSNAIEIAMEYSPKNSRSTYNDESWYDFLEYEESDWNNLDILIEKYYKSANQEDLKKLKGCYENMINNKNDITDFHTKWFKSRLNPSRFISLVCRELTYRKQSKNAIKIASEVREVFQSVKKCEDFYNKVIHPICYHNVLKEI